MLAKKGGVSVICLFIGNETFVLKSLHETEKIFRDCPTEILDSEDSKCLMKSYDVRKSES